MNKEMNIERRSVNFEGFAPKVREAKEGEEQRRTIEGYAVVFGQKSQVLYDWRQQNEYFREIIEPGAVTEEDLEGFDVRANLYHKRDSLLARWNGGNTGGLELYVDEQGVGFRFEAPNCPDGDTAYELVKRGVVDGCSFAFIDGGSAGDITWTKDEDGVPVRHVHRIGEMYDICITPDPAYPQTSVSARDARQNSLTDEEKRENERIDAEAIRARQEMEYGMYLATIR